MPPLPYGRGSDFSPALLAVWLGGSLVWWTIAVVRLRRFQRLLRRASPAPAEVQEQARRLATLLRLRRCPPVVFVSAPVSPMLWALGFSHRLLIPADLWRKLTAEQQDTLLAHELAHQRRGDHWVRRLEFLVLGLYWWHPVVWWGRRRLQQAEEECCDALVVAILPDAAPAYASALVQTVAFLSRTRSAALVGGSGIGHVALLKRRLTMILSETSSRKPSRIAFWTILGLGALLLPLAPQPAKTEPPGEPKGVATKGQPLRLQVGFPITVTRMDTEEHPSKSPSGSKADHAEEIEKLQDEIELLKVQVRLKEAKVEASQKLLEGYKRRLESYRQANKNALGAIPQDTIQGIELEVTMYQTQLKVHEAELQEPLVRLKQAERRLARLQPVYPYNELAPQTSWNITWAEALVEKPGHDFGAVRQGTICEHKFVMTNHGQRPVVIESVRSSAGCLSATLSQRELPPGGEATIRTRLDTSKFTGRKMFRVFVQFEKPAREEIALAIHADSQPVAPRKLQNPERLQELEKKLDALRKEMENLRREMGPDKPH